MLNYLEEIAKIKVNRTGPVVSLHKPLLLLLTIADVVNGHPNFFAFKDIESHLKELLSKYGLKNTRTLKPEYPFFHLGSSPTIWKCSIDRSSLINPNSITRGEALKANAQFDNFFFQFLQNKDQAKRVVWQLLNAYWPEAYHEDILRDIGIDGLMQQHVQIESLKQRRGRLFVEEVLDSYERQCAICSQSIRLGDALIGIDACHVKPIQHFGDDHITNGIALCKIHHWALDRGAISISENRELLISPKLNGNKINEYFHEFSNKSIFTPHNNINHLNETNAEYHREYIFEGGLDY
jgi:putative restriction endonuclease